MGTIKTAMELAMERTASLKSDRAGVDAMEARKEGMRLAAAYLAAQAGQEQAPDLQAALKAMTPNRAQAAREGILDSLLTAIQFPRDNLPAPSLRPVEAALCALGGKGHGEKSIRELLGQLGQFFDRYVKDLDGLEEELKRQFAPKLKQKEQEIRRRTGQDLRIDPMRDPEFVAYFQKSMSQVKARYQETLDQAKAKLREFASGE